jgi:tetratricopeptide (TPR) repeat protein
MARAIMYARASGKDLIYADVISMFLSRTDALAFGEVLRPLRNVSLAEEIVEIYERHGDMFRLVDALASLCNAKLWEFSGESDVVAIAVRARRLAEEIDYPDGMIWAMVNEISAWKAMNTASPPTARYFEELMEELLRIAPQATSPASACEALITYGGYLSGQGKLDAAIESISRSAAMADDAGLLYSAIVAYTTLALVRSEAEQEGAIDALLIALDRAADRSVDRQTVWVVEIAASFLARAGQGEIAARLIGSAEYQRSTGRNERPPWDVDRYQETEGAAKAATGSAYADLVSEGTDWTMKVAVEEAVRALSLL